MNSNDTVSISIISYRVYIAVAKIYDLWLRGGNAVREHHAESVLSASFIRIADMSINSQ
jgi:hypothetical protein